MRHLKFRSWIALLTAAIALQPDAASAQVGDSLSIVGTFKMDALYDPVRPELAAIFANGGDHWWRLTLHGATLSHERDYQPIGNGGYDDRFFTRVHATSFTFEFFGPDAAALNAVVGSQLSRGSLAGGAFVEYENWHHYDPDYPWDGGGLSAWSLGILPADEADGISFFAWNSFVPPWFNVDANGYPVVEPQRLSSITNTIWDRTNATGGFLQSEGDIVDVGAGAEPVLPPEIAIGSAAAQEGDQGTTVVQLTVTLARSSAQAVTVNYATANGSADAGKDYVPTSGSLTFAPGQTSRTIEVAIKGERKREPDETFKVRISSGGATITEPVGTVTIRNDD